MEESAMENIQAQQQDEKCKKLRTWNLSMFFLHFVQGIVMLALSSSFALPVTTAYVEFNVTTQKLNTVLSTLGDIRIGPLVAAFLFLSALAHLLVSVGSGYRWYVNNLKKGMNLARWIEYSFSSSLMIVVIALLVGVYDLSTLILLFFLNAMMILFGWIMEVHNHALSAVASAKAEAQKTDWTSFIFGCIAGAVPWIVVALYLFNAGQGEFRAPTFVYWIYFSIFLFFNVFAINMILQYKKAGKWRDYLFGEKTYIILSLVAKSLLAWQVFAGTLRPV
jgi:hypothetical protein